MTYDEIKAKFGDRIDKDRGDHFTCQCPGHDDNKASLSVSKGDKPGFTVVKCFGGCELEQILKPIGLTAKDLCPNGAHSNGAHSNGTPLQSDPVVAVYDYKDAGGKLIFQVQRRQSKKFVQRRPDGTGSWVYNMNGVQRILYRLPEIVTSGADVWVLIPEGEKDVDNLRRRGYVATTNAGGASQPWLDNYSESLRGRLVCVLPDNDEPGRKHAQNVAQHLLGIAADVRILALPGLPEKGDVTDWLDDGNDPKTLLDLVKAAPSAQPTVAPEPAPDSPALGLDEILGAIRGSDSDKKALTLEVGPHIAKLDRQHDVLIADALVDTKLFTLTGANSFIRGCVADHKKRQKAEQKAKAKAAKAQAIQARAERDGVTIQINNRQLSEVAAEALDAIRAHNGQKPAVFVRAGALARVAQDERGLFGIQELNAGAMLHILSKVAEWESVVETEAGYKVVAVYPPYSVGVDMLSAGEWPGLPGLMGIVSAPVFSRDGALHSTPGYDSATRLYYTGGVKIGDTTPTPANIQRAKDLIFDNLLVDFPFKDDASKAHAFAYLLLPFVRDMIDGPTPPHLVESPTAGTGKGMLLTACAYPFLGHDASTMAAAKDDDEWRKRITTSLMNGNTHLVIDNVNHELDSGSLATAFTSPVWEDRTLGANREVRIPIRTVWAITANNIKMSQELARRCIWIRLDASEEKPWLRTEFKHKHLIAWARSHRNELATAALCFVRAWIERGMPLYADRTKGSYEAWAGVLGGILETVGIPGFLENENDLYDRVVSKNDLLADFIKVWWDKFSNTTVSAYELFKLASYADSDADNKLADWHNLLSDMLTSPKQRGRQTELGIILKKLRDNVVAGYKITFAKSQKGMHFWRLEAKRVEPQTEVLPTEEGSTYPLPPVEGATNHTEVEPSRTSHPHHNDEETFFYSKVDVYSNGKEKNSISDMATGGEVLLGSTYDASTTCKTGVEPQNGGSTYRQSLPAELWESGLASFAEAQQVQKTLAGQWKTTSGKDEDTGLWFVRCPDWQRLINA